MNNKKCPVCDWEIKDDGIDVDRDGRSVRVCCEDCAARVRAEPAKYVDK